MKPKIKDGQHFRWFYHPVGFWTVAEVHPWDSAKSKTILFDLMAHESFLVSATKDEHWGATIKRYRGVAPKLGKFWLKRKNESQ